MECWDRQTQSGYRYHDEFVAAGSTHGEALGFCARCGEIIDEKRCRQLAARGNLRCQEALRQAGIGYLTSAEKQADEALASLTPEQRALALRRNR